jgi:hypothetical protein
VLEAEGQAKAIETVFAAIHEGKPDSQLLAYQYLQTLPQLAQGSANKMWIVPSELTSALGALGQTLPGLVKPGVAADPAVGAPVDGPPTSTVELPKPADPVLDLRDGVGDGRDQKA